MSHVAGNCISLGPTGTHRPTLTSSTRLSCLQAAARQFDSLLREYNDVRSSLAEGQNFYAELQEEVQKLHQQVGDYCYAR